MTVSQKMPVRALIIAGIVVAAGIPAGLAFAEQNHIPAEVVRVALPAILLELLAYLSLASEQLRARWTPWVLTLFAPVPLLLAHSGGSWKQALLVLLLVAAAAWWFRLLPAGRATDFGFLALAAAPILFKWLKALYADPHPELDFAFAGQLMWIRATIVPALNDRRPAGVGFGFWPTASEWRTGLVWFSIVLLPIFAANALAGFAQVGWPTQPPLRVALLAAGTFFGILWVVALSEEFLFRGLLQQWLAQAWQSPRAALLVTSLLFGAVHLGFRAFPNWKFSLLAAIAGVAYGMAFNKSGGIRAAMVAHASLVTVWRLFLH